MYRGENAYVVTCVEPSKKWGRSDDGASLILVLGLVRIPRVETDLLITLNSPVTKSQFGDEVVQLEKEKLAEGSLLGEKVKLAESVVTEMLQSLEIRDWGLFA